MATAAKLFPTFSFVLLPFQASKLLQNLIFIPLLAVLGAAEVGRGSTQGWRRKRLRLDAEPLKSKWVEAGTEFKWQVQTKP